MFEQAFKNVDNALRKEAGCTTELDYTEQTSWLLFLKYLEGLEQDKAAEAKLEGKKYSYKAVEISFPSAIAEQREGSRKTRRHQFRSRSPERGL